MRDALVVDLDDAGELLLVIVVSLTERAVAVAAGGEPLDREFGVGEFALERSPGGGIDLVEGRAGLDGVELVNEDLDASGK